MSGFAQTDKVTALLCLYRVATFQSLVLRGFGPNALPLRGSYVCKRMGGHNTTAPSPSLSIIIHKINHNNQFIQFSMFVTYFISIS